MIEMFTLLSLTHFNNSNQRVYASMASIQGDDHSVKTRTIKTLHILAQDKVLGSPSNCQFAVILNNAEFSQENIATVGVKSITCPNLFHNVWPGANTLVVYDVGGSYELTLTTGRYTSAQLIEALEIGIPAVLPTVSTVQITVDEYTGQWTVTSDAVMGFSQDESDQLALHLGIMKNTNPLALSQTFDGVPLLDSPNEVFVYIDYIGTHTLNSKRQNLQLAEFLPLHEAEYGQLAVMRQESSELNRFVFSAKGASQIRVTLRDKYGLLLSLPANAYPSIMLTLGII